VGNKMYQYSFKRDEDGKLSDTGTYRSDLLTKTSFKYPEQARFSFGVARVKKIGATTTVGLRCDLIDYTMRNIVTEEVYQKHIKDECNRVRSLTSETSTIWTKDPRPKNIVWEEDDIAKMPGAGGKKGKLLVSAGITKVNQLKSQTDEQLLTFANNTAGISFGFLTKLRDTHTLEGTCPHQHKDYRKEPNPYLAKYGEDEWRNEIEKTVFMKKYMSIRELIKKMYDNSKKVFEGTTHQEDWYFYHDAQSNDRQFNCGVDESGGVLRKMVSSTKWMQRLDCKIRVTSSWKQSRVHAVRQRFEQRFTAKQVTALCNHSIYRRPK